MEVHGHRGAALHFPDNSQAGIAYALKCGVDAVEIDLHLTKDNTWVLSHDPDVPQTVSPYADKSSRNPSRYIRQLDWHELQDLSLCSLDEVCQLWHQHQVNANNKGSYLNLEIKYDHRLCPQAYATRSETAELFAHAILRHSLLEHVLVQSFDWPLLRLIRDLLPTIPISPLYEGEKIGSRFLPPKASGFHYPDWNKTGGFCQQIGAVGFSANARLLQAFPGWKALAREDGHRWKITAWTVNSLFEYYWLKKLGVDAIISDDPDFFMALRDRRRLMPLTNNNLPSERG